MNHISLNVFQVVDKGKTSTAAKSTSLSQTGLGNKGLHAKQWDYVIGLQK